MRRATGYRRGVSFCAVIPIKRLDSAKRRLLTGFTAADTAELAFAFALDTLTAALACSAVIAVVTVTEDARVRAAAIALGSRVLDDPGTGLNAAVRLGIASFRAESSPAVAVLTGDLPSLTSVSLRDALNGAASEDRAMVADAAGTGTTLITARAGQPLVPWFGANSRIRHEALGHRVLEVDERSPLRLDVDVPDDLAAALLLGVGPATSAYLRLIAARSRQPPENFRR